MTNKKLTKIYLSNKDADEFVNFIRASKLLKSDFNLLAFYRGGLPIGVRMSNILDKELHVIFMQTRDMKSKYQDRIFPEINKISDDGFIVIEDIIDSGKTIDLFMQQLANVDVSKVYVFAMIVNKKVKAKLEAKYPRLKIIGFKQYSSLNNKWIVFPWETPDKTSETPDVKIFDNKLIADTHKLFAESLNTMIKKNHDYTGNDSDPFKNFKSVEALKISTVEQGLLVRLSDKFSRIAGLLSGNSAKVNDESVTDTIEDAINYFAILHSYLKNKKES